MNRRGDDTSGERGHHLAITNTGPVRCRTSAISAPMPVWRRPGTTATCGTVARHVVEQRSRFVDGLRAMEWLRSELAANRSKCTAVYWHRPLFSSGRHGDNPDMRDVWRTLYAANVDVVINGHDHTYERFAPQDPDGRLDTARGT